MTIRHASTITRQHSCWLCSEHCPATRPILSDSPYDTPRPLQASGHRELSSRQLAERALAAIDDPAGEGARSFIRVHRDTALALADRIDAMRGTGARLHPLAGVPISLKDLFDEAGVTTLAASRVRIGGAPDIHHFLLSCTPNRFFLTRPPASLGDAARHGLPALPPR